MHQSILIIAAMAFLVCSNGCAADQPSPVAAPATKPANAERRELLSRHDTVAVYDGTQFRKCMGLTSLCPDQCGQSGNFASFTIKKYLAYEKPGQYGDPEQTQFMVQIDDTLGKIHAPAEIAATLKTLKPGEFVHLCWNHDYVTIDGSSSPQRPITLLQPLPPEQAAKLMK